MTRLRLMGGLLSVDAPNGSEIEYVSPKQELVLLPDGREVHVSPSVIRGGDRLFKPRIAIEHTLDKLGARMTPRGDFFRDVQVAFTSPSTGVR